MWLCHWSSEQTNEKKNKNQEVNVLNMSVNRVWIEKQRKSMVCISNQACVCLKMHMNKFDRCEKKKVFKKSAAYHLGALQIVIHTYMIRFRFIRYSSPIIIIFILFSVLPRGNFILHSCSVCLVWIYKIFEYFFLSIG